MCVLFEPLSKSPSQCPGTARSSASAGRSWIDTASMICPRGCPFADAFFIDGVKRGLISSAFVDRDCFGRTVPGDRTFKEASRSSLVTFGGEKKIDGGACTVNGSVKVFPLASDQRPFASS